MSNKITNAKPMLAYTYISHGKFELIDKPKPELQGPRDAIVRITLGSICTSDMHIKHGSVPRAVPGITVGHAIHKQYTYQCNVFYHTKVW